MFLSFDNDDSSPVERESSMIVDGLGDSPGLYLHQMETEQTDLYKMRRTELDWDSLFLSVYGLDYKDIVKRV